MAHAKWSPSSAHRWLTCFASMAEELPYMRVGASIFADEGTAAHTLMEWTLQDRTRTTYDYPETDIVVETWNDNDDGTKTLIASNTIPCDTEMREYIGSVVVWVRGWQDMGYMLLCEQRVDFSEAIGIPNQFGTADIILISPDGTHVIVADLKYGKGVKVYAENNHQMLCYGVGTLETFGALGDFKTFTLAVLQPRMGHLDMWDCTREDVVLHGENMKIAGENTASAIAWKLKGKNIPDKFYNAGKKTCQWCKAKAACPKYEKLVVDEVMNDFTDLDSTTKQETMMLTGTQFPPADRLGKAFANLDMIEAWCAAVRAECERQVINGMTVLGVDGLPLKLIEGRKGNRTITDETAVEALLAGRYTPDKTHTAPKLASPAALEKLLKKEDPQTWEMLQPYIQQSNGKPKVVEGSAEGVPYTGAASATEFATLEDET